MTSVLPAQEETWPVHQVLPTTEIKKEQGLLLDSLVEVPQVQAAEPSTTGHLDILDEVPPKPKVAQQDIPLCVPTNPGTLLHPGSCTPCAFVFRVAEGQVRNRCTNGDSCGWCHHPSHPRTRGRRQKSGNNARNNAPPKEETWTDKNSSDTSTRDTWSDRGQQAQNQRTDRDDHAKTTKSFKDDRGKSTRSERPDRKSNRQRPEREERSRRSVEKVERCNTPEFDEQYGYFGAQQQAPQELHFQPPPQAPPQDDGMILRTPVVYRCVPIHAAIPMQTAEVNAEWPGYTTLRPVPAVQAVQGYPQDWNAPNGHYDPDAYRYQSQYMMVRAPQEQQWAPEYRTR